MTDEILKRLAMARKQAGLSQSQAARLLGVSERTIGHWESKNKRCPPLNAFIKMCELYDVNIVWVMTGENPYFEPGTVMHLAEKSGIAKEDVDRILDLLESTTKLEKTEYA